MKEVDYVQFDGLCEILLHLIFESSLLAQHNIFEQGFIGIKCFILHFPGFGLIF